MNDINIAFFKGRFYKFSNDIIIELRFIINPEEAKKLGLKEDFKTFATYL
jgi:hypothetical protein